MELTETAKSLESKLGSDEELTQAEEELATCMGTENFGYALFDGGYLKPEQWVAGEDLVKLKDAIETVKNFKYLVESLHEEM